MRVGLYECDITPPLGCFMWGQYAKNIAYDVFERLYAKAAVIENEGKIAAILTVDTCTIPPELHDIVTKRIYEYTGIEAVNVLICSLHTHKGASVSDSPEINCFADSAYKDVFMRLCADAVILAYKRCEETQTRFGTGEVNGVSFNRTLVTDDGEFITFGFDRDDIKETLGPIDPTLSVLVFERNKRAVGAVVNFALHQDSTGNVPGYSGDYSAVISKKLKEKYGEDFVSVFVLGACGDINHIDRSADDSNPLYGHRKIGAVIAEEAVRVIETATHIDGNIEVIKEKTIIKNRLITEEEATKKAQELLGSYCGMMRARNIIYYAGSNEKEVSELYIQGIKIGDLCIFGLPGEIFTQIGMDLKSQSPFKYNIVIENCNSYCGYVPTKEAFASNSDMYESTLCYHSCLVPEACDIIKEKALEISNRLIKR